MISYVFGYLIGQNIAWLLSSWVISLLVCAVVPSTVFIFDSDSAPRTLTAFLGWASVVVVPEFVLQIGHATFDGDTKNQLLPLLAVFDALVFVVITIVVNVNDSSPIVWVILLAAHVVYVWGIQYVNHYAKRVRDHHKYFFPYMLVLIFNDVFFLIVALVVHGHPLNFISVLIASALTAVPLFLSSRNEAIMRWVVSHGAVAPADVATSDIE